MNTNTREPSNPKGLRVFPEEERAIIEDLPPEQLVERAIIATWCLRIHQPEAAYHTLVIGPTGLFRGCPRIRQLSGRRWSRLVR